MQLGLAIAIFKDIENLKWTDDERAMAIFKVLNMETHNSIFKADLLKVLKWLFEQHFQVESESL